MALEIINNRIVGTINDIHSMNGIGLHDNLQDKLEGKLPITREELIVLINSWGRTNSFCIIDSNDFDIIIKEYEKKECYTHLL